MDRKIICVSGYFDPIHVGHIEYFKEARKLGTHLVVIVNNDYQAQLKKGRSFMPEEERIRIIQELKCVDDVILSIDDNRTVCKTLENMYPAPDFFCNGGDQTNDVIPEAMICIERGIELRDGMGNKIQSSSWLIGNAQCN